MQIRAAQLDDTQAIVHLHTQGIARWQRLLPDGQVEDVPYARLSLYERWLHGGAWMSIETGALWLSHLLRGAGLAWVLLDEQQRLVGYAEGFVGDEPAPYGKHLYLAQRLAEGDDPAAHDALMQAIIEQAAPHKRVLVSLSAFDEGALALYARYGFSLLSEWRGYTLSAQTGQTVYKVNEAHSTDAAQIAGWGMIAGRSSSARHQWEVTWTTLFDAIPAIAQRRLHRLRVNASGHEALVAVQAQPYNPRTADVAVWSPKPFSQPLLSGLRDWAHRQGYRALACLGDAALAKVLGAEAEATPQRGQLWAREV